MGISPIIPDTFFDSTDPVQSVAGGNVGGNVTNYNHVSVSRATMGAGLVTRASWDKDVNYDIYDTDNDAILIAWGLYNNGQVNIAANNQIHLNFNVIPKLASGALGNALISRRVNLSYPFAADDAFFVCSGSSQGEAAYSPVLHFPYGLKLRFSYSNAGATPLNNGFAFLVKLMGKAR